MGVLDTKLFTPGKMLPNNTLWIVEQIPGLVYGEDMTEILETGYWPSYNIPAFPIICERSGYGTILNQTGDQGYTSDLPPRPNQRRLPRHAQDDDAIQRLQDGSACA